ncbi:hypothetical protein BDW66DRAFT_147484 [Aspergillus desertorum]
MAQVSALFNGGKVLYASHRSIGLDRNAEALISRLAPTVQAIVNDRLVGPTAADFGGRPIELLTILGLDIIVAGLAGEIVFKLHQAFVLERNVNEDSVYYTRQYGYRHIFRAGLGEYYMTWV